MQFNVFSSILRALLIVDWSLGHLVLCELFPQCCLTLTMQGTLKRLDLHLDMPLSLVPPVLTGQVGIRTLLQSPPLKQNSLLPMLELQMELGCLIYSKNLAILNPLHSPFTWTINLPSRLQEIQNIMEG